MSLFSLCGVLFVSVCAVILIKENGYKNYALILSALSIFIAAAFSLKGIGQAFDKLTGYLSASGFNTFSDVIIKAFGICFVCEVSSDTLSELGSDKMGKWVETAGKAEILLLSLPLINELLDKAVKLL